MSAQIPVVTVTASAMDGTVVRWHRDLTAARNHNVTVSASRNGVMVPRGYVTDVPAEWMAAATGAYEQLRANPGVDLTHLATHRNCGFSNGPLEPVERGGDGG